MAKGKSGLSTTASGAGVGTASVKHPVVDDINFVDPYMSTDDKEKWLKNTMLKKLSDTEAAETIAAAEHYSMLGYNSIHNGHNQKATNLIDAMIEDPNAPVYNKTQYRGIHVSSKNLHGQSPKEWIEDIIKKGVWTEPGVSSFSATKSTAMSFGHFGYTGQGEISILITNHGHTKGMPFKHISECTSEDEVLHSSKTMLEGMKITGYHTNKKGNEYFIEVDDSIPVSGGKTSKKK